MGRLAMIQLTCPHCGEYIRAILPNEGRERPNEPDIKCEKCNKMFKFVVGMLYKPLGYVT